MASACTQKDKGTGSTNVVGGTFQHAGSRIPHAKVQCNINVRSAVHKARRKVAFTSLPVIQCGLIHLGDHLKVQNIFSWHKLCKPFGTCAMQNTARTGVLYFIQHAEFSYYIMQQVNFSA
jgi:hypothetical protein